MSQHNKYYFIEVLAKLSNLLLFASPFFTRSRHHEAKGGVKISFASTSIVLLLFLSSASLAHSLQLSVEEQIWLKSHPVIRIAFDNNFPPFEWKNNKGIYQGLSVDNIKLIEKQLNIKFKQLEYDSWTQMIEAFKQGKIDILPAIAKNTKRQKFILFTRPHITIPGVIISAKQYNSVQQLRDKKIGVVIDYFWDDLVTQYDDQFDIIRVENTQSGIELAAFGSIDAMVTDLASATYIINNEGISNLQVVPVPFNKKKKLDLALGIRKDWPQLQTILQKTLDNISLQEKQAIRNKWIKLRKVSFWQAREFWYSTLLIITMLIAVFVFIILWNWSLKSQVKRRTEQLENAQKQLIHAEKMESIGRLSAGVAHEVKNPLAILQMCIDYLKGENNTETVSSVLDDMDDAVLRADSVIKGLLDFSREKELQFVQGDINKIIDQSIKLIQHELKQNNIQIDSQYAADLPLIDMDKNRLKQVFINLFINAVHAIKSSQRIENRAIIVKTGLIDLNDQWFVDEIVEQNQTNKDKLSIGQKVLSVTILDNGCGLKSNDEKKIFEPFFTTKPPGEGTGLGLSVSKTIIGLHHGVIAMRNRIDEENTGSKETGVEIKILFALKNKSNGNDNDEKNISS